MFLRKVAAIAERVSRLEESEEIEQLRKDLAAHVSLDEKEFKRLDNSIETGFSRIDGKLDLITQHLLNNPRP